MAFIEETIVLKDTKLEEINKYFIDDKLSDAEKITYIIKKGYLCQKQHLIKIIPYFYFKNYPNNINIIWNTISNIMEDIEIWEKDLQLSFSNALKELCIQMIPYLTNVNNPKYNEVLSNFSNILKYIFTSIANLEKIISDEYIINLDKICKAYKEKNLYIKINDNLNEYASTLGKYGQSITNRKFSAFICRCLIMISKDKNKDVYKRIEFLIEEPDKHIIQEMAYQIRFIIPENSNQYCKEKLSIHIENYLKEKELHILSTIIESLLYKNNYKKFEDESSNIDFTIKLIDCIKQCFDINDYFTLSKDFKYIIDIFINLLEHVYNTDNLISQVSTLIVEYISKYYIIGEVKNSCNVTYKYETDYLLKNFHMLLYVLNKTKKNEFLNVVFPEFMKEFYCKQENANILYNNLHLIFKFIPHNLLTKKFINKTFYFLHEDKIEQSLYYDGEINIEFNENWLSNFEELIKTIIDRELFDYMNFFLSKFNQIFRLISNSKDYKIQKAILSSLIHIPEFIFKNYLKFNKFEEHLNEIFDFINEFSNKERSHIIEETLSKLWIEVMKYSYFNRNKIINSIKTKLLEQKSFYRRRFFCFILDYSLSTLSISYNKELGFYDNILVDILEKGSNYIKCLAIDILIKNNIFNADSLKAIQNIQKMEYNDYVLNDKLSKFIDCAQNNTNLPTNKNYKEEEKINNEIKIKETEFNIIQERQKNEENNSNFSIKKSKTKQLKISTLLKQGNHKQNRKDSFNCLDRQMLQISHENKIKNNKRSSVCTTSSNISHPTTNTHGNTVTHISSSSVSNSGLGISINSVGIKNSSSKTISSGLTSSLIFSSDSQSRTPTQTYKKPPKNKISASGKK